MTQTKPKKKIQQIFDTPKNDNVGITLWTDETFQAITKNSGKLTRGNEYQVHYWSLNIRAKSTVDGSILDIAIPTLLFNYKQQVSGAHIDFELDDVDNVSNALEPINNIEVNKLLPIVKEQFESMGGAGIIDISYSAVNLNSIHRHPGGRRQSFSGTDYNKDAKTETGIVFPLAEGEMKPNFASIIAHDEGKTFLARTEYRLVNGKIDGDKGEVTYSHGRCMSFVKSPLHTASAIEKLFGYKDEDKSYTFADNLDLDNSDVLRYLVQWWNNLDYQPNTDFINPANVSEKQVKRQTTHVPHKFGQQRMNLSQTLPVEHTMEDVITFALESYELTIPHPDTVLQLGEDERQLIHNELEMYYYTVDPKDVVGVEDPDDLENLGLSMHDVTQDDFIELYNNVVEEIREIMDDSFDEDDVDELTSMRQDLLQLGADSDRIVSASDTAIRKWHNSIFGEQE